MLPVGARHSRDSRQHAMLPQPAVRPARLVLCTGRSKTRHSQKPRMSGMAAGDRISVSSAHKGSTISGTSCWSEYRCRVWSAYAEATRPFSRTSGCSDGKESYCGGTTADGSVDGAQDDWAARIFACIGRSTTWSDSAHPYAALETGRRSPTQFDTLTGGQ